eukprot:3121287-Pleurochrysis_carterae.AAC.1
MGEGNSRHRLCIRACVLLPPPSAGSQLLISDFGLASTRVRARRLRVEAQSGMRTVNFGSMRVQLKGRAELPSCGHVSTFMQMGVALFVRVCSRACRHLSVRVSVRCLRAPEGAC